MKLQKIYDKEITRHINPAVVVSELDEKHIHQEIEEYVFTKDIINNIYKFLNAVFNKDEGKTGVWISGYYGSGKSHFIKYLFYCLRNSTREKAFEQYKSAFDTVKTDALEGTTLSNVALLQNQINRFDIEEIIFNIDAVAGHRRDVNTITRILFNQLNRRRGYYSSNLAVSTLIEKHLDELGKLSEFKEIVKAKTKREWNEANVRDIIAFRRKHVIEAAYELDSSIDKISLEEAIRADKDYTIEELVRELKQYVSTKEDNYRLIFLMDEVSQYIGTNTELLLNLQTIVEEVGSKIGNKVWIVCTAQQDLSNLVDNTENRTADDFGKIKGRFETMISLESQDAAYITQKRILDKSVSGQEALTQFYKNNRSFIENQFEFNHDLYRNYKNAEDFYLAYPFIPYQFRLISDVFQSFYSVGFVEEGVRNTERSILGITHFTAKETKDKKVGYFIAFDDFFNEQFSNNLTHAARNVLDRAFNIQFPEADKAFANRVIKVLFMISNLTEDQQINFPANLENITLLLLNNVSDVKIELQQDVQKILDKLVDQNVVQQSEGKYKFLDDEGVRVANSIATTVVNTDDRLSYFYEYLIRPTLRPEPNISIGNRNIRANIKVDQKQISNTGDNLTIKFVVFDDVDILQEAMNVAASEMLVFISSWFNKQSQFKRDFNQWAKTAKYIANNRATATGSHRAAIEEFGTRNEVLLHDLRTRFDKYFSESPFSSSNNLYDASNITITQPNGRYKEMVQQHVETIYKHHGMSNSLASSNAELQQRIRAMLSMPAMDKSLNSAESEVNNKLIQMGGEATITDLIRQFERPPYGWRDLATLQLIFSLAHKKHRTIYYQNEELMLNEFYDKAINSASRGAMEIKAVKDYDRDMVNSFKDAVHEVFMVHLAGDMQVEDLVKNFQQLLADELNKKNDYNNNYTGYPFHKHIRSYVATLNDLQQIRSREQLMQQVIDIRDHLRKERDLCYNTTGFINDNFSNYETIKRFYDDQKQNFDKLDVKFDGFADDFKAFFVDEDQPADDFPVILKKYRDISTAIKEKLNSLKEKVLEQYKELFDELEKEKQKLNIDNSHLLPDRQYYEKAIKKSGSIIELENHQLRKDRLRLESLQTLAEEHARFFVKGTDGSDKPVVKIHKVNISKKIISGKTISNEKQIDELLVELRKALMNELTKNDKLFLE